MQDDKATRVVDVRDDVALGDGVVEEEDKTPDNKPQHGSRPNQQHAPQHVVVMETKENHPTETKHA